MSRRKGFPRIVKSVRHFTPDHPVAQSIDRGSHWFHAWVAQMTTPYDTITRKTGIARERLFEFSRCALPAGDEIEALAALWHVTPEGLLRSIEQFRDASATVGRNP